MKLLNITNLSDIVKLIKLTKKKFMYTYLTALITGTGVEKKPGYD